MNVDCRLKTRKQPGFNQQSEIINQQFI